jgi:hypothetical protein
MPAMRYKLHSTALRAEKVRLALVVIIIIIVVLRSFGAPKQIKVTE